VTDEVDQCPFEFGDRPSGMQEWTSRWKSALIGARSGSVDVL